MKNTPLWLSGDVATSGFVGGIMGSELFIVAILAVAAERLVVVAAALVAIVLGWNLFTRAITLDQSGSVSVGDWKVELKSVGPGVFFSLFGTIVLVYALVKPAQYTVNNVVGAPTPASVTALGVGKASDNISRSYVRAVNTVAQIQMQVAAQPATSDVTFLPTQKSDLSAAVNLLEQFRRELLVAKFGAPLVDEWEKYGATYRTSRQTLPLDVRNQLEPIAPWFTETVTDETSRPQ
jgi:hypothetical protein